MSMTCSHPDCDKGPFTTGDALFRTNPKGPGEGFIGRCEEHLQDDPDEIVKRVVDAIQDND